MPSPPSGHPPELSKLLVLQSPWSILPSGLASPGINLLVIGLLLFAGGLNPSRSDILTRRVWCLASVLAQASPLAAGPSFGKYAERHTP